MDNRAGDVGLDFDGSALGLFWRSVVLAIGTYFIIPAPWVSAWYYNWFFERIDMPDHTKVSFIGQGEQIWLPMMAAAFISGWGHHVHQYFSILLFPLIIYLTLLIMRWVFANITLDGANKISFVGEYIPLLGWYLLLAVSIITIIGWAWVMVIIIRWVCENLRLAGHKFYFYGSGGEILWRTICFILSAILIIPIPWTALWLLKWYLSKIVIQPTDHDYPQVQTVAA